MKTKESEGATKVKSEQGRVTIGIDLGDRFSHYCVLNAEGKVIESGRIKTSREAFVDHFKDLPPARMAVEAGTHSAWVSRLLEEFGHEVLVANAREIPTISHSNKKNDNVDAEKLGRYARYDPKLLSPIRHRSQSAQLDLVVIRVRERLVAARTMLINATRGIVKSSGYRLRSCSTESFAKQSRSQIPDVLSEILLPILDQIATLTDQIRGFNQRIEQMAESKYPETKVLRGVKGVGPLTAMSFVLTVGDAKRFRKSRDVGCYLGLRPRRSQSGERDPQLGITKAGNRPLRVTLVQCAQYILGPFGPDSALRRWGLMLAQRGGTNAKKRALVAVARKAGRFAPPPAGDAETLRTLLRSARRSHAGRALKRSLVVVADHNFRVQAFYATGKTELR